MSRAMRPPSARERGFSLLELLVAMTLGWLVIAALFRLDLATSRAGRLLAAQTQMDEDAQIGLQLLSSEVMQAGYASAMSVSSQVDADGQRRLRRSFEGAPVFGCTFGFVSPGSSGEVACASSGDSAGLEVRYEADAFNTIVVVSTGAPGDCLGNSVTSSLGTGTTTVAFNRYYVEITSSGRSELKCASRGMGGQPLVENVEKLQVWYGLAAPGSPRQLVRFVQAGAVSDFNLVVSLQLCLLLRSQDPVLSPEEAKAVVYTDCDQSSRSAADGRLRKAYVTTVALRNKMPL